MTREDLLFEYFEGGLDHIQEESLFGELQNDGALREEFNQQMKILLLARQDATTISAPLESTESIFSELGINKHYYYAARRRDKFFRFINSPKVRRNLATASIAILLLFTSMIVYEFADHNFWKDSSNTSLTNQQSKIPVVSSREISTNSLSSEIPNNSTTMDNKQTQSYLSNAASNSINLQNLEKVNEMKNSANYSKLKNFYSQREKALLAQINSLKNSLEDLSMNNGKDDNSLNSSDEQFKKINYVSKDLSTGEDYGQNKFLEYVSLNRSRQFSKQTVKPIGPDFFALESSLSDFLPKNYKYEVSLKSNSPRKTSPDIHSGLASSSVQNFEFSAGFKVNSSNQFGLVIGRDNFPQNFTHTIDGQQYVQIQNPVLYYYGAYYKYSPQSIFNQTLAVPYLLAFGSGTTVGPYFKAQAGLEFNFFRNLSVIAGIENSILIYNVENTIYSTNKVNFVYGLNIKF